MKRNTIPTLIAAALTTLSASAAAYVSNFNGLAPGESLAGFDGWTESSPGDVDAPWAFGATIGTRPAAAVAGYYNTDPAPGGEFHVSQTISLSYPGLIFDMDFSIVDSIGFESDGEIFGTERNTFRIGFQNGGLEVFALIFSPNFGAPDPDLPPGATLNVFTSINGVISATASAAIYADQLHQLQVNLLPDGNGNLNYDFSLTAASSQSFNGVVTGANEIDELQIGIDELDGQYGDNQIVFGNIVATIPEPSSMLLVGAAVGGFALRRRRQIS